MKNFFLYLLYVIVISQGCLLYITNKNLVDVKSKLDTYCTREVARKGFRFVNFRIDELEGSLDGTWNMAKSAWDMANPSVPPSAKKYINLYTPEEIDSIWCYNNNWTKDDLEYWRLTGKKPGSTK